jgi:pilus assembly protein Flp/PilA
MVASFLFNWVKDNIKRQEGQAMAEYGIILALIAAIVIGTVATLGTQILAALSKVTNAL